jgi:hypothetical protein
VFSAKKAGHPAVPAMRKSMRILAFAAFGVAAVLAAGSALAQDSGESISVMLNHEHGGAPVATPKRSHKPAAPVDPVLHPAATVILGKWYIDTYTPIYMELRPDGKLVSGWLAGGKWKARAPLAYKFKDETHFQLVGAHCAYEIFKLSATELGTQCGQVIQTFVRATPPAGVNAPFDKPPAK